MTDLYFVDTNVLVYARDSSEPLKQKVAADWLGVLWTQGVGRLSYQVLQEYYQAVTRRLTPGMSPESASADIRDLISWQPIQIDSAVLEMAWDIESRYRLSWWDALIVGAANRSASQYLLSEDLQHGQTLGHVTVLNPFETEMPSSV
ncbi:PIN domain-containing protein [Thioalkalivibrio sulfidiphilus]|uniref:PilT domain-containing protein n=1 Tax=Thioalkalivibrio sulfidiphilus (strain HL-EbGR7) TaxID=396588 RepID=B8GQR5_THISH|nr:PIN domain-containing protein [Thioalkalivibrio sulfidiphilus]ACL74289.1 PilT domain-containing protein [Thioalkalivibrio sulfidiphilus HL-EbGr7]